MTFTFVVPIVHKTSNSETCVRKLRVSLEAIHSFHSSCLGTLNLVADMCSMVHDVLYCILFHNMHRVLREVGAEHPKPATFDR